MVCDDDFRDGGHAELYEACLAAQKSCALNDPTGCGLLGLYYLNGQTCVKRDLNKAIKYFKMSCDNTDNDVSCFLPRMQ